MKTKTDLVQLTVKEPDDDLFERSEQLLELADMWTITSPAMVSAAGRDLLRVKALAKEVDERRLAITRPINQGLKEVNGLFRPAKTWLGQAETILKAKILEFQQEQQRIADELQAELDLKAEKERKKLEKKAAKAEAKGKTEKVEELQEEIATAVAPVVVSAAPKLEGVHTRKTWKVEVVDKASLILHIANERPDLLPLLKIDVSGLNAQARSLKGEFTLPGILVTEETSLAARR